MFEIGTTRFIEKLGSDKNISRSDPVSMAVNEVEWSPDGRYISIGGSKHTQAICIAQVGEVCFENILRLIDAMRMNSRFW